MRKRRKTQTRCGFAVKAIAIARARTKDIEPQRSQRSQRKSV
jgi:hypothetical protein